MLQKRLEKLQQKLKQQNIDAVITTHSINRAYITGFYGTAGYAVIMRDHAYLLVDFRYTEQARKQAPNFQVIEYDNNLYDEMNHIIKTHHVETLGFEDKNITCAQYEIFKQKINVKELIPARDIIDDMRKIKDPEEIRRIQEAARIADMAYEHILTFIRPGQRERELALELEFFMKKHGAQALSFDMIVASGIRSSLPHGQPTDKVIESGELVTMDFGCVFEGYCSDMTRTIGIGYLNEKQKEIYRIVLEAQQAALNFISAGKTGKQVDQISRDIISNYGYGKNFGHSLGHGVGCEIHEAPRLSSNGEESLQPGMVVTVEPGIYIENFGGVRIEDMVLITEDGIHNFTSSSKELFIL